LNSWKKGFKNQQILIKEFQNMRIKSLYFHKKSKDSMVLLKRKTVKLEIWEERFKKHN